MSKCSECGQPMKYEPNFDRWDCENCGSQTSGEMGGRPEIDIEKVDNIEEEGDNSDK